MTAKEKNEEILRLKELLNLIRLEFRKDYIIYRKNLEKETISHIESIGYKVESIVDRVCKYGAMHIIENAYKISW